MIEYIRLQQQAQQVQQIGKARSASQNATATYKSRDATTGQRILEAADGGLVLTEWLARTVPTDSVLPLVSPSNTIGRSGYASQREGSP
jgi:hypothetical protein